MENTTTTTETETTPFVMEIPEWIGRAYRGIVGKRIQAFTDKVNTDPYFGSVFKGLLKAIEDGLAADEPSEETVQTMGYVQALLLQGPEWAVANLPIFTKPTVKRVSADKASRPWFKAVDHAIVTEIEAYVLDHIKDIVNGALIGQPVPDAIKAMSAEDILRSWAHAHASHTVIMQADEPVSFAAVDASGKVLKKNADGTAREVCMAWGFRADALRPDVEKDPNHVPGKRGRPAKVKDVDAAPTVAAPVPVV